jgi:membrane protease YdiL (CAAX protease family)
LWARVAASTALAAATVVVTDPLTPRAAAPSAAAATAGVVFGAVLFAAVVHRPPWRVPERSLPTIVTIHFFLGLCAVNEEVLWRRLVLGEALRAGVVAAVAISAVGFALAHRSRRRLHLVTGAAFGVAYVVTGSLLAPVVAHWTYNSLVAVSSPAVPARPAEVLG